MSEAQKTPNKPDSLPLQNIDWNAIIDLVGKANLYIVRYDGLLYSIINPDVTPFTLKNQRGGSLLRNRRDTGYTRRGIGI